MTPTRAIASVPWGLRVTDQETARVVAVKRSSDGRIVGAGCLLSSEHILTCKHVVEKAFGPRKLANSAVVNVWLVGVLGQPTVTANIERYLKGNEPTDDLALLRIQHPKPGVELVEFAAPLRHAGKRFSVLGFPSSVAQGRNAVGLLQAVDAKGLIQMDSDGALLVQGGFSGAPVWCQDVSAFVGIVVSGAEEHEVSWCIPSARLSRFCEFLPVRFRIPPADRPPIFDYIEDDPNVQLFGTVKSATRKFTAKVKRDGTLFKVELTVRPKPGAPELRGKYVTFITHSSLASEDEDPYELFSAVDKDGVAENHFWCGESFTVAAIADASDTVLTIDLGRLKKRPSGFK